MKMRFKYFSLDEFSCVCGCKSGRINPLLVTILDKMRDELSQPITVKSGIRCYHHNQNIGGRLTSQHVPDFFGVSHAADISCYSMSELFVLCEQNFLSVGDGRAKGFIHVDMRSDRKRRWIY